MSTPTDEQWSHIRFEAEAGTCTSWKDVATKYRVRKAVLVARVNADAQRGDPWKPKWAKRKTTPTPAPARDTSNVVQFPAGQPGNRGGRPTRQQETTNDVRRAFASLVSGAAPSGGLSLHDAPAIDHEGQFVNDLTHHDNLAGLLEVIAVGLVRRLARGEITPGANQSHADVALRTIEAVDKVVKLQRLVAGKADGEASGEDSGWSGITITQRTVIPERIPVDEKGRKVS